MKTVNTPISKINFWLLVPVGRERLFLFFFTTLLEFGAVGQIPIRIDFEQVPDVTPFEGLVINNQFSATTGIFFSTTGGGRPVLAEIGNPATAFESAFGDDTPAPNQGNGKFFLTDDGKLSGLEAPPVLITSVRPLQYIEGVILDIDFDEIFTLDAFDDRGNILETLVLDSNSPNAGDGLATSWRFEVSDCEGIQTVRITGERKIAGVFGLGLDNIECQYLETFPGNLIRISVTDAACEQNNGTIRLENENPQPVEYSLNGKDFVSTDSFSQLAEGTYTIYIRNVLGCLDSITTRINQTTIIDDCGVCLERGDPAFNQSCLDCAGIPNGDSQIDKCGVCLSTEDPQFDQSCALENELYIPNAFSPNGDGHNDLFRGFPNERAIVTINRLMIFSHWGELVHDASEFNASSFNGWWDGTCRGTDLAPGVFTYYLRATFSDGEVKSYEGDVMLVR